jgi:hypothetical protein
MTNWYSETDVPDRSLTRWVGNTTTQKENPTRGAPKLKLPSILPFGPDIVTEPI